MRIALRTSGGRGEYELAGQHAGISFRDLLGLDFVFQLTPDFTINARCQVHYDQAKPRIRLNDTRRDIHPYRIVAALLLLPAAKRELGETPSGAVQLKLNRYSITSIPVQILKKLDTTVVFSLSTVEVANSSGDIITLNIAKRLGRVFELWKKSEGLSGEAAALINSHRLSFVDGMPKAAEVARNSLYSHYNTEADLLSTLLAEFGISPDFSIVAENLRIEEQENDTTPIVEARVRQIERWRLQAQRGPAARKFRSDVRQAYRNTCFFTGRHYPRLEGTVSQGIDASHILPWANFDADVVSNGLCLSKEMHWAFDGGILRLDQQENTYIVSIPERVRQEAQRTGFTLSAFEQVVGEIPKSRLPDNPDQWPSTDFLRRFNELLFS